MSTKTGLLSKTYTVTVTGEAGAKVAIRVDGRQWRTVTLNGSGTATVSGSETDLLGLLGAVAKVLGAGNFSASYV